MGKAQSKRSVDITTETKKGAEDEVTEKMEKIEDLDKKEVLNGDATLEEKHDPQVNNNIEIYKYSVIHKKLNEELHKPY